MPWIGGKTSLIKEILPRFPTNYNRYIEVFGGGASVLFAKKQKEGFEVYNDYNENLVNLFRVIRDKPISFLNQLHCFPLNSRKDFEMLRNLISGNVDFNSYLEDELSLAEEQLDAMDYEEIKQIMLKKAKDHDVLRAVTYFKLIRYSYGAGGTSYGCRPINLAGISLTIANASERLKNAIIENKDFQELIRQYDRIDSFFYCDPPYFETESYYEALFSKEDHKRLNNVLSQIQGKFLLSYNDCEFIRELYKQFYIASVSRKSNLSQRYEAGADFNEVLIANYDLTKRSSTEQISLFKGDEN